MLNKIILEDQEYFDEYKGRGIKYDLFFKYKGRYFNTYLVVSSRRIIDPSLKVIYRTNNNTKENNQKDINRILSIENTKFKNKRDYESKIKKIMYVFDIK